ncbi:HEPN domain-containing protein [Pannus brasiliensis CCIBt3594]|uniref:HEPN domain-containing protein n=1 Tax=Pannus brasiliensis CCIBt3594 TaxID=1427578 RepID=A0AAW9QFC8_9CHRO
MTPEQQNLIEKAKQSLEAAKVLQTNRFADYATSRAYYSMFYAVEALLLTKNLSFSSHQAVIAALGREFAR